MQIKQEARERLASQSAIEAHNFIAKQSLFD
jgi:hypothetical protein